MINSDVFSRLAADIDNKNVAAFKVTPDNFIEILEFLKEHLQSTYIPVLADVYNNSALYIGIPAGEFNESELAKAIGSGIVPVSRLQGHRDIYAKFQNEIDQPLGGGIVLLSGSIRYFGRSRSINGTGREEPLAKIAIERTLQNLIREVIARETQENTSSLLEKGNFNNYYK